MYEKPKINEIHKCQIQGFGKQGDAICKVNKFVIFVSKPKGLVGDYIKIKITQVFRKIGFGEIVD